MAWISYFVPGGLIILFETICFKLFLEIFLRKKEPTRKWLELTLLPALTLIVWIIAALLYEHMIAKQIIVILAITVAMWLYFDGKMVKVLALTTIFMGIFDGFDSLGMIILRHLGEAKMAPILEDIVGGTVITLICRMFVLAFVLFLKRKWNKKDSFHMLPWYEWLKFLYCPGITVVALIFIALSFNGITDRGSLNIMLFISFGLVSMNVVVIYLIRDIMTRETKLRESDIFKERMKRQTEMYTLICENYEIQRKKTHEYKNQMGCIAGMLKSGHIEETLAYVEKLSAGFDRESDAINTNNVYVNAVLNTKYAEARGKGISMVLQLNDLSDLPVKDEDIVTILSNLLNNAIEACEGNDGQKMIKVKLVKEQTYTTIAVLNTTFREAKLVDGRYLTNKENGYEHGIGIGNIKETVDKYQGSYVINEKDGFFNFIILIPNHEPGFPQQVIS